MSLFLGIDDFFFIKLFHAVLFSYLAVAGLPGIAGWILGKKVKTWQRALLAAVLYYLWLVSETLINMWVDLPRFAYLVYAANQVIRLNRPSSFPKWLRSLWAGFTVGTSFCLAGVNSVAGICLMVFAVASILPLRVMRQKAERWSALLCVFLLMASSLILPMTDALFEKNFVAPLRNNGAWILTKESTLLHSFSNLFHLYSHSPDTYSPRAYSLLVQEYGQEMTDRFLAGVRSMPVMEYIRLTVKYPVDMITMWANRLFLLSTPSYATSLMSIYFLGYTLMYLTGLTFVKRGLTWGIVVRRNFWLALAFLMTLCGSVVGIAERRMGIPIQGFYITIGLCSDTLWNGFRAFGQKIRSVWQEKSLRVLKTQAFPWSFCLWAVFLLICFTHIWVLLQLTVGYVRLYPNLLR